MGGMGGMSMGNMMGGMGTLGFKQQKAAPEESPTGRFVAGMIKSYNGLKGFGFISSAGIPGDVFFMKSAMPEDAQSLQGKDVQGKTVNFEIVKTSDGKVRGQNVTFS
mmetsp:Transcript_81609/g.147410  ORF Transcript_81609/g.147410 Transcript_81609/m.147410 type:complete len:107 (+) Transcript_81609:1-321(+)